MHLYNLTLSPPTSITHTLIGSFSATKQELILVRGATILELYNDQLIKIATHRIIGLIRTIAAVRLTGAGRDYITITSDSGYITILEFQNNEFKAVHNELFGKSGVRRVTPGQYIAQDPKGRAIMLAALEKNKLVYILNRDINTKITISSPLEAHKQNTHTHDIVGVDVGFDNPIFAALEVDCTDSDEAYRTNNTENTEGDVTPIKNITYYELDLGLNHVVRKWNEEVEMSSSLLITVPGGDSGPSGVLVCSESKISWHHQGCKSISVRIPRRDKGQVGKVLITAHCILKRKSGFWYFVQTELGDIFKLQMTFSKSGVDELQLRYLDTVAVATSIALLKNGTLFVASEFGDHYSYIVESLLDEEGITVYSSEPNMYNDEDVFTPNTELQRLRVYEIMPSLSPLTTAQVFNGSHEDTPQLYCFSGRGANSSLRVLRHGLEVTEFTTSNFPGTPSALWTIKGHASDLYHKYIVLSFATNTLVLHISGGAVEEAQDSGLLLTQRSICVHQVGDEAIIQVYPSGVRHVHSNRKYNDWKAPQDSTVVHAAANQRQVIIALSGGDLVYFELDDNGTLNEYNERQNLGSEVQCVALGPIPEGKVRSPFLAVGLVDGTARIISLDPSTCLEPLAMQVLNGIAESITIIEMVETHANATTGTLYMIAGLSNGLLMTTKLDETSGTLTDSRARYLGTMPIKLFKLTIRGYPAVLALSSRPWLSYTYQGRVHLTPLSYGHLNCAAAFDSEGIQGGIVAVSQNKLRFLTIDTLGAAFNQTSYPLQYTPRSSLLLPGFMNMIVVETDHRTSASDTELNPLSEADSMTRLQEAKRLGWPRAKLGTWSSSIRIMSSQTGITHSLLNLPKNEAAISICFCVFHSLPMQTFVVVGSALEMKLAPRSCKAGYLTLYEISKDGKTLREVQRTTIPEIPTVIEPFHGRLLVGVTNKLRLYDMGKLKLLRKCEAKVTGNLIVKIQTQGDRIILGDVQDSITYVVYNPLDNVFTAFADDTFPRWINCFQMIDFDTCVLGDKFGNISVIRLPTDVSRDIVNDNTGSKLTMERSFLQGAAHRLERVCEFYIGDTVTSLTKVALIAGASEVIVYTTLQGAVGVLIPIRKKEDVDFFQNLELQMKEAIPSLISRDHLHYRGFMVPVKGVIDGDLCEMFNLMPYEKREHVASEVDREVAKVSKDVETIRTRVAF